MIKLLKYLFKRLTCKHSCELKGRLYTDGYDIQLYYECVKCGKQIIIEMDRDSQIKERELDE